MNKHQPSDRLKSYRGAVGKLVTLRTISAVQEWSMEAIIQRAYTTMVEQFIEHPPTCQFSKYLVKKVGPQGYDENGAYFNCLEPYLQKLNKYVKTKTFTELIESVLSYFELHFKILRLKENIKKENKLGVMCNSGLYKKEFSDLQKRKREKFFSLGMSYAKVVLGSGDNIHDQNDVSNVHHMKAGRRQFQSYWRSEQILNELAFEFLGTACTQFYENNKLKRFSGLNLSGRDIRIELGYVLRTNYFNPFKQQKIDDTVGKIRKDYFDEMKSSAGLLKHEHNNKNEDFGQNDKNDDDRNGMARPQSTREYMRKRSARLAAERRALGQRPNSAVLVRQRSLVIDAVLKDKGSAEFKILINKC